MIPALNVNIYFTQKIESILSTETTMIAISSHLWNNLILIVHHIAADIHVYLCWRELVLIRRLSKRLWDTLVLWHSQRKYIHTLISGLNSFRINKTLKHIEETRFLQKGLNSFRINKTLKPLHGSFLLSCSLNSFRINKTLKPRYLFLSTHVRLNSFRINKTLKPILISCSLSVCLNSFRINKTLKPLGVTAGTYTGLNSFRINKTLKQPFLLFLYL